MPALLDHLRSFIAFRTVGKDTATKTACLDWILNTFLSSSGLELARGDVKGAPYLSLRHPKPKMLWFGHTDVVPAKDEQFVAQKLPEHTRFEYLESADPTYCDPQHPMVGLLQRIAQDVHGAPVRILREHGASDARFFTARGIPAFLYGPVGGDLHGAGEWVSVKSLERQVEINRRWLGELAA